MEKVSITLQIEDEKLRALEIFLRKEDTSVKKRMDEALQQLYESAVPEAVREYVDCKVTAASRDRSRRPTRPAPVKLTGDRPGPGQEGADT